MKRRVFLAALAATFGALLLAAPVQATLDASVGERFEWTNLGDHPLVPGGVPDQLSFAKLMTSAKGKRVMAQLGLPKAVRTQIITAVQQGRYAIGSVRYGERFPAMAFGAPMPIVVRNVIFHDRDDSPARAWVVTVRYAGKKYTVKVPLACGNLAPKVTKLKGRPKPPKEPPPKPEPTFTVSGAKFNDLDGSSFRAPNEPGLSNWEITLADENHAVIARTRTDSRGRYVFAGVAEGLYFICEVQQPGWRQTKPVNSDNGCWRVMVTADVVGLDFGNVRVVEPPPPKDPPPPEEPPCNPTACEPGPYPPPEEDPPDPVDI